MIVILSEIQPSDSCVFSIIRNHRLQMTSYFAIKNEKVIGEISKNR